MSEYEKLMALAEAVTKHITVNMMKDDNGKPYLEVSMWFNNKMYMARVIEGKESERDSLPVALVNLLLEVEKQKPIKKQRQKGTTVRQI